MIPELTFKRIHEVEEATFEMDNDNREKMTHVWGEEYRDLLAASGVASVMQNRIIAVC